MSNLLFEHMIRIETATLICRIWAAQEVSSVNTRAQAEVVIGQPIPWQAMLEKIAYLDGVNSVEILNRTTLEGMCVHRDWP